VDAGDCVGGACGLVRFPGMVQGERRQARRSLSRDQAQNSNYAEHVETLP